jgi:hypothetical protein
VADDSPRKHSAAHLVGGEEVEERVREAGARHKVTEGARGHGHVVAVVVGGDVAGDALGLRVSGMLRSS